LRPFNNLFLRLLTHYPIFGIGTSVRFLDLLTLEYLVNCRLFSSLTNDNFPASNSGLEHAAVKVARHAQQEKSDVVFTPLSWSETP
jgi:hypothetical protein